MLIRTASLFPRKYPAKMTGRKKKLRNANLKWTRKAMAKMPSKMSKIREPSKCLRKNVLIVFMAVSRNLGASSDVPLVVVLKQDHKSCCFE